MSASATVGKGIYYQAVPPFQGDSRRASATLRLQPTPQIEANLSYTFSDFFRGSDGEKMYEYHIGRVRLTYQLNRYLFFRAITEYNRFRNQFLTDFLASFTYVPGTVAHAGYGSMYEKVRWDCTDYVASDRFLETRRGFFFKVSYLWRI